MRSAEYPCLDLDVDNRSASVVQIESSKLLPMLVIVTGVAVAALIGAAVAWTKAEEAKTEARMGEYYITRLDAILVRYGITNPGEDFQKFKAEQSKE